MTDPNREPVFVHEIKVKGNQLVDKVKEVVEEGNARSVSIKKDGRTVLTFPLSVGVGGATAALLLAPTMAAIGAFAALVTDVSIVVERVHRPGIDVEEQTTPAVPAARPGAVTPPQTEM